MKLIIAGGRDYQFTSNDTVKLFKFCQTFKVTEIVSGGASGADAGGEEFARGVKMPVKRFPAEWNKHGRAAGPIRNAQMAHYADAVALFPGGIGTNSMHKEATKAGIDIYDWRE